MIPLARAVLGGVVVLLLAIFTVPAASAAHEATNAESEHVYLCDGIQASAVLTDCATERGPPASRYAYNATHAPTAVDRWYVGTLARSGGSTSHAETTYNAPIVLAQVAPAIRTTSGHAEVVDASLSSFPRWHVAAKSGATNFVGRKGVTKHFDDGSSASYGGEINIARGTNAPGVVNGRAYSGHAFDQMQGRGLTPSVVDDAIGSGVMSRGADGSRIFYGSENNISVVVNSGGRVITVGYGAFKPR